MKDARVTFRLEGNERTKAETMVQEGKFKNLSELSRHAVKALLCQELNS